MATLGVGHFQLCDKTIALTHAVACESGLKESLINDVLDTVRVGIPDSGTERLAVDAPNVISHYLEGHPVLPDLVQLPTTHQLPKAFWNPEANHQWDLILRTVVNGIAWFSDFFDDLSFIITFIRNEGYRKILRLEL